MSITVKFFRYNVRNNASRKKKKRKGKGYSMNKTLTALRMNELTEARTSFGFTNVWTQDGKIHCREDNNFF